jgi:type IV pilus assembly protein PilE
MHSRFNADTHRRRTGGFTLLELMIAVALIAILTTVALPAYTDYAMRGRIPDGTGRLATLQVQFEQYFQDNRTYVNAPGCANDTTTSRYFDFSCPTSTATAFTIAATGKDAMSGFRYTIDQNGTKVTTAVPTSKGWSLPSTNCWALRKDGSC